MRDLPEAKGFALAGGAALIVHGIIKRTTRDLDFFSVQEEDVDRLVPVLESALLGSGFGVSIKQHQPGFARLLVSGKSDVTVVDLGYDFRLDAPVRTPVGPVVSQDELGADKMLALFSRAEARDFIDVYLLSELISFERLCELAAAKDPGFSLPSLAEALDRFRRLERADFDVDDDTFRTLARWVADLIDRLSHSKGTGNT
jgi:hypothetical protein